MKVCATVGYSNRSGRGKDSLPYLTLLAEELQLLRHRVCEMAVCLAHSVGRTDKINFLCNKWSKPYVAFAMSTQLITGA